MSTAHLVSRPRRKAHGLDQSVGKSVVGGRGLWIEGSLSSPDRTTGDELAGSLFERCPANARQRLPIG